ncbi:MAG TPA: hypothetical protein VEI97_07460 [bacterium]|nr:hypothetical protein [bacterium]
MSWGSEGYWTWTSVRGDVTCPSCLGVLRILDIASPQEGDDYDDLDDEEDYDLDDEEVFHHYYPLGQHDYACHNHPDHPGSSDWSQVTCPDCLAVASLRGVPPARPAPPVVHAEARVGWTHCGLSKRLGRLEITQSWTQTTCGGCLQHAPQPPT